MLGLMSAEVLTAWAGLCLSIAREMYANCFFSKGGTHHMTGRWLPPVSVSVSVCQLLEGQDSVLSPHLEDPAQCLAFTRISK